MFSSCCESANSNTKDACCHVDGLKDNPPIWVPVGPGETTQPPVFPPETKEPGPDTEAPSTDEPGVGPDDCTESDSKYAIK